MVPATGFEPVRFYSLEPESSASANSATRAQISPKRLRREAMNQRPQPDLLPHRFPSEQVKTDFASRESKNVSSRGKQADIGAKNTSASLLRRLRLLRRFA